MEDFSTFLDSMDIDKLEFDAVNEITGDISSLFEYVPEEGAAALMRIMHGMIKAYLRQYHDFLREEFDG